LRFRQALERGGNDLLALAAFQRSERTQADEAALRRLELPLLVVVGERDGVLESARELAAAVPDAELIVVAGEDHASALPAGSSKEAVSRFLRERAAQSAL
jgi:pimeloyl-ACP methyl ester carboxylesterase